MESRFEVKDSTCFWCGREKETVVVEIKKGQNIDLCWSCLKTRANAISGRLKNKGKKKGAGDIAAA